MFTCDVYVIACHVFPGSLTLREVRTAMWGARAEWYNLGLALGLPMETLEVIKGHAVSQYPQISDLPRIFEVAMSCKVSHLNAATTIKIIIISNSA